MNIDKITLIKEHFLNRLLHHLTSKPNLSWQWAIGRTASANSKVIIAPRGQWEGWAANTGSWLLSMTISSNFWDPTESANCGPLATTRSKVAAVTSMTATSWKWRACPRAGELWHHKKFKIYFRADGAASFLFQKEILNVITYIALQ